MKMKKMFSTSMAMVLAFCMLVQLLPVFPWSPATAQAASYTKTLSFIDKTSTIKPGASYVASATMDVYGWQMDTEKTTASLLSRFETNTDDIHRLDGSGLVARFLAGESGPEKLVVAFDVDSTGVYNVESTLTRWLLRRVAITLQSPTRALTATIGTEYICRRSSWC